MKKMLAVVLTLAMVLTMLAACGKAGGEKDGSSLDAMIQEAQGMTTEQLLEKAKGETGAFIAYGNTSRIVTAMSNFVAKYGADLGLTEENAVASKQSDSEIYTLLTSEADASDRSKNASFVLVQDSATLMQYRQNSDLLANYIPNGMASCMDENDMVPLAHQFINKLFIWNNTAGQAPVFSNVWALTEDAYAGKIYFKSPTDEQVNMNFLIMLTGDQWSGKLKDAYTAYFGGEAEDVGEGKTYKNYGYKWIAEFLHNVDFTYTSDTKMAAGLSEAGNSGKLGLFVLSKLRDSSVTSENLSVAAWEGDGVTPFSGFMYSIYAQLCTHGNRPYTAMLFTNFLMTEEGFAPWAESVGGYSANSNIPVFEGDRDLSFWKPVLVVEDGAYISSVKAEVEDWINSIIG